VVDQFEEIKHVKSKRWPIGLQSDPEGDPHGINEVIKD